MVVASVKSVFGKADLDHKGVWYSSSANLQRLLRVVAPRELSDSSPSKPNSYKAQVDQALKMIDGTVVWFVPSSLSTEVEGRR